MSFNNKKLTNILYKNSIPLVDFLLLNISQEYNIPLTELEKRYKTPFERKQVRNTNKKGRMTGYSMFLKDIKVTEELRVLYPDFSFSETSKKKGEIWKVLSNFDKDRYKNEAEEFNKPKQVEVQ